MQRAPLQQLRGLPHDHEPHEGDEDESHASEGHEGDLQKTDGPHDGVTHGWDSHDTNAVA